MPNPYRLSRIPRLVSFSLLSLSAALLSLHPTAAPRSLQTPAIVISQIYGGGGNSGAPFRNDFVELFNRGDSAVDLSGWAIQYVSASGSSWSRTELQGEIAPGGYYLIQLAGGANGAQLPAPDASGTIAMAATSGKVALTNTTTALSGACPASAAIVDLVGYGSSASCFEGAAPAPAPSATRAIHRGGEGCNDSNDNAADFTAAAPAPRNSAAPARSCAVQPGARFTADDAHLILGDAAPCAPVPLELRLTNSGAGAQIDAAGPEAVIDLPAGLKFADESCQASAGQCLQANRSRMEWNGAIGAGETVTVNLELIVEASHGARICFEAAINYDGDGDGANESMTKVPACATASCSGSDPGLPLPASTAPQAGGAGSILVYPFYVSSAANSHAENTRLAITNAHTQRDVTVHLFFVESDSASVADQFICLTPNQTHSFLASDIDPNVAGYLIAVAVDSASGCPIDFNHLIGDAYVKLASGQTAGHATALPALAFAALTPSPALCQSATLAAELRLDGVNYSAAPRVLAASALPSPADGYSSIVVIDRLDGSLMTGLSTIGQVTGLVFNDMEEAFSFTFSTSRRQFRAAISSSFPRTAPRLDSIIPAGRTGWMKFWRASEGSIVGVVLTGHEQTAFSAAAHAGGRNLHALRLTAARLTMPIMPPGC